MDFSEYNWAGLAVGISTFLIIGLFHPLVIKGEYYFGRKVNWAFAILGVCTAIGALFCKDLFCSSLLAVIFLDQQGGYRAGGKSTQGLVSGQSQTCRESQGQTRIRIISCSRASRRVPPGDTAYSDRCAQRILAPHSAA